MFPLSKLGIMSVYCTGQSEAMRQDICNKEVVKTESWYYNYSYLIGMVKLSNVNPKQD